MKNTAIQFIIELTNVCNFNCTYCYLEQSSNISNNNPQMMSTSVAKKTIE